MNILLPSKKYPLIFKRVINFAKKLSRSINVNGIILSNEKWNLALIAGIKHPYKIRILKQSISFSEDKIIQKLSLKFGLTEDKIAGMAIGYNIMMHPKYFDNDMILLHELRHVAQYIACGSLDLYLDYYLMEVVFFGYGSGPMENDANFTSHLKLLNK